MGFITDFITKILSAASSATTSDVKQEPLQSVQQKPLVTPPIIPPTTLAGPVVIPGGLDYNRQGDFIITDIYPPDLGDHPNFKALVGMKVSGKEVIGCYLKASEGLAWGTSNEVWFKRCWAELKSVAGDRYGKDFFRGAYHFLRFSLDGAAQAKYFCDLVDSAGGFDSGCFCAWVDVEEGGQGSWAPGPLESLDVATKARLAASVTKCTTDFVNYIKIRYPGMRVGLYGRGVFRDLNMKNARFNCDIVCDPAYTATLPPMDQYGWPDVAEWQICGDGQIFKAGYPSLLPGWGRTDYSVSIMGSKPVTLVDVRMRQLAFAR